MKELGLQTEILLNRLNADLVIEKSKENELRKLISIPEGSNSYNITPAFVAGTTESNIVGIEIRKCVGAIIAIKEMIRDIESKKEVCPVCHQSESNTCSCSWHMQEYV